MKKDKNNAISLPSLYGGLASIAAWLSSYFLKAEGEMTILRFMGLWIILFLLSFIVYGLGVVPFMLYDQEKDKGGDKLHNVWTLIVGILINATIIWYIFWR